MTELNLDNVLAQMRSLEASGRVELPDLVPPAGTVSATEKFADALAASLDQVNQAQQAAGNLQDRYLLGETDVNLADVMVAGQKSQISFQTLLQVRNRMVEAYQEIMRMPM